MVQNGLASVIKLLLAALVGIALALSLLYLTQRRLIYLPTTKALTTAEAKTLGLRHWPDMIDYRGFIAAGDSSRAAGTVVIFHGNAGAAYHRTFYIDALQAQDLRVILAEYPGYGGRPGKPSESLLIEDAVATIRHARRAFPGPLYLWGESLGCGVVGGVVERLAKLDVHGRSEQQVAGIVLLLPWDSLTRVAQVHYKLLPVSWLLHDRYPTTERMQHYRGKVAVIVASEDEIIPPPHSLQLYHALPATKKLWLLEGATHNQLPIEPDQPWWREVARFLTP